MSAGPGGYTAAHGLEPDILTVGKSIAGGVPLGAYGMTREIADRVLAMSDADLEDTGGVGGTLAGNALSLAAARATLRESLTAEAFARMIPLAERFTAGVRSRWTSTGCPGTSSSWAPGPSTASGRRLRATGAESAAAATRSSTRTSTSIS